MLIYLILTHTFIFITSFSYANNCEHSQFEFKCVQYISNYDGDTIKVNIPNIHPLLGNNINIRLKHIDTPEIKGKLPCEKEKALEAKSLVHSILKKGNKIEIKNISRGKYFRIVGELYIDEVNLAELLIANNLAVPYDGKKKSEINWCNL